MSMCRVWLCEMGLALLCICCQVGIWMALKQNSNSEETATGEVGAVPVVKAMRVQEPDGAEKIECLAAERRQERQAKALVQLRSQEEMLAFAAEELSLHQLLANGKCQRLVTSVFFVKQMDRFQDFLEERQSRHQEALQELEEVVAEMDCSSWTKDERQALETYLSWRRRWAAIIYDPTVAQEEKLAVAEEFPLEASRIAFECLIRQFKSDSGESLKRYNQISRDLRFDVIHRFEYPGPMRHNVSHTDAQGRTHSYAVELF